MAEHVIALPASSVPVQRFFKKEKRDPHTESQGDARPAAPAAVSTQAATLEPTAADLLAGQDGDDAVSQPPKPPAPPVGTGAAGL
jgi:hypothetical protein